MRFLLTLSFLLLMPQSAEAADLAPGSRVLVKGRFQRKCAARVASVPAPGYFRLTFDRAGCGDAGQPYERSQLQSLTFVEDSKLRAGDHVVVKGYRSLSCAGRVREVSASGYVAVDFDSLLCADTETLRRSSDLTRVTFVDEISFEKKTFKVGQQVKVNGIGEKETCGGVIRKLTQNGLASVDFQELTCAYGGRLYGLGELMPAPGPVLRRASGESIFRSVMRQIASKKKTKKSAVARPGSGRL